MKLTLLSEDSIRLEPVPGPMTIEAISAEQSYSPFHMMAGGLAYCTFSVMHSWATDEDDGTTDERWGRVGKQRIEDTGPLTLKRMETCDDEFAAAAKIGEVSGSS